MLLMNFQELVFYVTKRKYSHIYLAAIKPHTPDQKTIGKIETQKERIKIRIIANLYVHSTHNEINIIFDEFVWIKMIHRLLDLRNEKNVKWVNCTCFHFLCDTHYLLYECHMRNICAAATANAGGKVFQLANGKL